MYTRFKHLLHILFPVLIYQMANFSAQLIDTMMTGNFHEVHLAGVSMGGNLWSPFFTLMTGILSALTPTVGHHVGAKNEQAITSDVRQFLYIAFGLAAVMISIVFLGLQPLLMTMSVSEAIQNVAKAYLFWLAIGALPALLFTALRSFVDGLGLTRISMAFMLLLVPFNIFFNYAFIYGKFGMPRLGGIGAGVGTALTYWLVLVVVVAVICYHSRLKSYRIFHIEPLQFKKIFRFIKMGLPIGLAIFVEVAVFASVGLLMSNYSATVIAAHQSAMNFATFLYGFPLSMSTALTIVVSQELGRRDYRAVKQFSRAGITVSVGIAALLVVGLFFNRTLIARAYGQSPDFIETTTLFLSYALLFQFSDAVASPIQGILRGYRDTVFPFISGLVSYWLIGIPLGFLLSKWTSFGAAGLWIGLIVGLFVSSLLLSLRLRHLEKRQPLMEGGMRL
ncbi:MAG: MATE family efflux transporter [Aerococcaceae bacterium]|nr:MATE family efflux transporter [Aerococcaceae bacterium]